MAKKAPSPTRKKKVARPKSAVAGKPVDPGHRADPGQRVDPSSWLFETRAWAQDQSRRLLRLTMLFALLLTGSLIANVIQAMSSQDPVYFATTPDLRVAALKPLSQSSTSDNGVVSWATRAVIDTLSLDFVHWRDALKRAEVYYTPEGYKRLIGALKQSGNLSMIIKRRMVMNASPERAGVVSAKGMLQGVYTWKVEIPVTTSYETSEGVVSSQHLLATLTVQRSNSRSKPAGVAIVQIILKTSGS